MHIFTLLGIVVDNILCQQANWISFDGDKVIVCIDDNDIIRKNVLPLCDDECDLGNGNYRKVRLIFKRNPQNRRGELRVLVFVDSNGKETPVEVGSTIAALLCAEGLDEPYYTLCDEIIF